MLSIFEEFVDQREAAVFSAADWSAADSFVDYLTLYAPRPADWPEVHGGAVSKRTDEGVFSWYEPRWCKAAYGSKYSLLVVEDRVMLSLNPSRVDRPDNVFGFRFHDCMKRVSDILSRHGCRGEVNWKVSRIDLTANVSTGSSSNMRQYLQQLRYIEMAHCEKHVSKYASVAWHNQAKRLHVYDKGREIEDKYSRLVPDDAISWLRPDKATDNERLSIARDFLERGIVRVELKLKKKGIVSRGLRDVEKVTQERLDEIFMKEVDLLKKVVLNNGCSLTDAELGCLVRWMQGDFSKENYAMNTYYKYRRNIREATGYDIASPGPISLARRREKIVTLLYFRCSGLPP
jgi:hypothetical protein